MKGAYQVLCLTLVCITYVFATDYTFCDDFSFGVATAAYQVEGAYNESGKGLSIWDNFTHRSPSPIKDNSTGDVACDTYNRYQEDIALAAATGSNLYRFSISWPRILPTGYADDINDEGIEYYQNVVAEILAYNMTPVATLYHWDLPQALYEEGIHWTTDEVVPLFVNYSRIVIESLPDVGHWVTINEPKLICRWGYGLGKHAPGIASSGILEYQCGYNILKSHAAVYRMYKEEFTNYTAPMSIVIDCQWAEPKTNSTEDVEAAERQLQFELGMYLHPILIGDWPDVVKTRIEERSALEGLNASRLPTFTDEEIACINGSTDWIGLNHYYTQYSANAAEDTTNTTSYAHDVRVTNSLDSNWTLESNGWAAVGWGLRKTLNWIKDNYGDQTILITETGYAENGSTLVDTAREEYYTDYFCNVLAAIEDGVDVRGIITWCLMDLFGWHNGYLTHFGLYYIDQSDANLTRTAKSSVTYWQNLTSTKTLTCDDSLFS